MVNNKKSKKVKKVRILKIEKTKTILSTRRDENKMTKTKLTPEQAQVLRQRHLELQAEKRELLGQLLASEHSDPVVERTPSNCNTNLQLGVFGSFLVFVVLFAQFSRLPPPSKEVGIQFLVKNRYKSGVRQTKSGLQYKIIKDGYGQMPTKDSKIKVDYEGRLLSGVVFDSSFKRGTPMTFEVSRVVKGWTEGLQLMKEGGEYELYLPSELAYGEVARGQYIYPNAVLIFKVNLIEVQTHPK